ncbi:hypothetical protein HNQ59_002829 [Chitinivorax tropicus]|uniref:Uncharacterized protein n=1 Tax=Chitinivorax tropicus TaxID=714531 RepID=A0A840MR03_9PROT|nr:hypothetical protein [Chitinivorax tropicus]
MADHTLHNDTYMIDVNDFFVFFQILQTSAFIEDFFFFFTLSGLIPIQAVARAVCNRDHIGSFWPCRCRFFIEKRVDDA